MSGLRRDQGVSSSTLGNTTSRRRIDDEVNWLDVPASEEDTTSDEEVRSHPASNAQSRKYTPSTPLSSISSTTLVSHDPNVPLYHNDLDQASYADQGRPGGQKPLISSVTNEWQEKVYDEKRNPYYQPYKDRRRPGSRVRSESPNCFDEMCEAGSLLECLETAWSRLTIRVAVGWIVVFFLLWTMKWWFGSAAQRMAHNSAIRSSVALRLNGALPRGPQGRGRTWFGSQHVDDFKDIHHIGTIRDEAWGWADGQRLIIVGDVHGCSDPLRRLLKETKFENGRDHLIFTGDLVAKGPDTAGVLDIARDLNASSVRGNHDDKLLLLHRDLNGPLKAMQTTSGTLMTGTQSHRKESKLAATLSQDQISYLRQCPLILKLGETPGLAPNTFIVHAGLVPGLELEKQEPSMVMNMRSIDLRTHTPLRVHAPSTQRMIKNELGDKYKELPPPWDNKKGKVRVFDLDEKFVTPWTSLWEEWQARVPVEERALVIYGHDSPVGLVDRPWAVGLDTGCVQGGRLTALILEMKRGKVTRKLQSVSCQDLKTERDGS